VNPDIHRLHLHQFDLRVKQWWGEELTDGELDLVAAGRRSLTQVLQDRCREFPLPAAAAQGGPHRWRAALAAGLSPTTGQLDARRRGMYSETTPASAGRNRMLYPLMIAAAIGVILLSMVGIATMTGMIPGAGAERSADGAAKIGAGQGSAPAASMASGAPQPLADAAQSSAGAAQSPPGAAAPCGNCGVIQSVKPVETAGRASGAGAVAGGVIGGLLGNQFGAGRGRTVTTILGAGGGAYAGNEVEKNMHKTVHYRVHVRMDDGSYRTLSVSDPGGAAVGQRVRIENGAIVGRG